MHELRAECEILTGISTLPDEQAYTHILTDRQAAVTRVTKVADIQNVFGRQLVGDGIKGSIRTRGISALLVLKRRA